MEKIGGGVVANLPGQEYIDIGCWLKSKYLYHIKASYNRIKRLQVLRGQVWYCDFGYNIGTEKNKKRPVLIISSNKINTSEKVVVLPITDAKNKLNGNHLPAQNSWYLLYSNTQDPNNMTHPHRSILGNNTPYAFLIKDSLVQCEEIRCVSKARLDDAQGCVGVLSAIDMNNIENKMRNIFCL